jgi:branched-chain amino acid transport system ATP-binding protein
MVEPLLSVKEISISFGGIKAIQDLSFDVNSNQIKGIIGPNGAGKTTIINVVMGRFARDEYKGDAFLSGSSLSGLKSYERVSVGIAQTFQLVKIFPKMTVIENVMIGAHCRMSSNIMDNAIRDSKTRREEEIFFNEALIYLQDIGLKEKAFFFARNLPYGSQKLLEIARAMSSKPKLLILDEPAAGMNTLEVQELKDLLRRIRAKGITLLIVEHNMDLIMDIADEILVMDFGKKVTEGRPENIQKNEEVIKIYLGEETDIA